MTPENTSLLSQIKAFYAAYDQTKGACATDFIDLCTDDVKWQSVGTPSEGIEFTEDGVGKDKVRTYLKALFDGWTMIHYTVSEIIATDERVVILADVEFEFDATSKRVRTPKADVLRIKDGQVTEFFEYFDTAGLQAATV